MGRFTNINTATHTTLITKGSAHSGNINKIVITNYDTSDSCLINLYLSDDAGSPTLHYLATTTIPPKVTLVLEDNLSFNASLYSLKIQTSTTADITVTIK